MIKRVGETPLPDVSYRMRHGVYAILPQRGGLLVTLQQDPQLELQLPGGGIDPGESPLQALYREVMEETGWTIAAPRRLGAFRRFVFMPEYDLWAEKLCTIYVAHPIRAISAPTEPGHTALTISTETAMTELGNMGDRMFVRRWSTNGRR